MRTKLFILLCAYSTFYHVNAQEVDLAAKFGFNIASVNGSEVEGTNALLGIHLGVLAEIPIIDEFYFQPEALISLQGAGTDGDNFNSSYLNFPLMGKYLVTDEIALEFGPQVGFLLGDSSDDIGVNTNSVDFGLNFGGGYRLNDQFYFQLRYNLGLAQVFEDVKSYNSVFQISASYFF